VIAVCAKLQFLRLLGVRPMYHDIIVLKAQEVAKEKLRDRRLSLSDVALVCGFADQSHLTRVFTGMVGVSPGAWRRALDE
jgi:AraC family transcriptional regulator